MKGLSLFVPKNFRIGRNALRRIVYPTVYGNQILRAHIPNSIGLNCQSHIRLFSTDTGSTGTSATPVKDQEAELTEKLKSLVSTTRVVLLMKGSPDRPECGFSARAVQILELCEIDAYTFVDIYKYHMIRDIAKKLFDWPTYPMLIVNGQLVGGIDVMQQLYDSGELKSLLHE